MKGNKIAIDRYLEAGEIVDSLDLSVNYLVKSTREGGTVPAKNIITWCLEDGTGEVVKTNTDTQFNFGNILLTKPAGTYYLKRIHGSLYTGSPASYTSHVDISHLEELYIPNVTLGDTFYSIQEADYANIRREITVNNITGPILDYSSAKGSLADKLTFTSDAIDLGYVGSGSTSDQYRYANMVREVDSKGTRFRTNNTKVTATYPVKATFRGTGEVNMNGIQSLRELVITNNDTLLTLSGAIYGKRYLGILDRHPDIFHIRVPNDLLEDYKMATNWSSLADHIIPNTIDYYSDLNATADPVWGNETVTDVWWQCTAHYHTSLDTSDHTFILKGVSQSTRFAMNISSEAIQRIVNFDWDGGTSSTPVNQGPHLDSGFILKEVDFSASTFTKADGSYLVPGYTKYDIRGGGYSYRPIILKLICCGATDHTIYSRNYKGIRTYISKVGRRPSTLGVMASNTSTNKSDTLESYTLLDVTGKMADGEETFITMYCSSEDTEYSILLLKTPEEN